MNKNIFKKLSMLSLLLLSALFMQKIKPQHLVSCGNNTIKIWNLCTGQVEKSLGHENLRGVKFNPLNSNQLVSWGIFPEHSRETLFKEFSRQILVCSSDVSRKVLEEQLVSKLNKNKSIIKIWNLDTGQELRSFECYDFLELEFNPANRNQLIFCCSNSIGVLDLNIDQEPRILVHKSWNEKKFNPANRNQFISLSKDEGTIKVWGDLRTDQELRTFRHDRVSNVKFYKSNQFISFSKDEGTIKV